MATPVGCRQLTQEHALALLVTTEGTTHRSFGPMCKPILSDSAEVRNSAAVELPLCPHDGSSLRYTTEQAQLTCLSCGWSCVLSPDESRDLTDALLGLLPDLRLDLFVAALAGNPMAA